MRLGLERFAEYSDYEVPSPGRSNFNGGEIFVPIVNAPFNISIGDNIFESKDKVPEGKELRRDAGFESALYRNENRLFTVENNALQNDKTLVENVVLTVIEIDGE